MLTKLERGVCMPVWSFTSTSLSTPSTTLFDSQQTRMGETIIHDTYSLRLISSFYPTLRYVVWPSIARGAVPLS